jgi:hypothetical protein
MNMLHTPAALDQFLLIANADMLLIRPVYVAVLQQSSA